MRSRLFPIAVYISFMVALSGCFNISDVNLLPMPDDQLSSQVLQTYGDAKTENRVLLLDIDGPITGEGETVLWWEREATTENVKKKLRKAATDDRIKAVVLRINSPGGTVTASDVVYREIRQFKAARNVPVVTMMMDVSASGGYYIACASDHIVAHKSTITGSIGVIVFGLGFDGLFHKIGMESRVVKSGELKDMGNPFDQFSEQERAVFQAMVDRMYDQFLGVVSEARKIDRDKLRPIADGRVYLGSEAKDLGLIDEVGYIDDAMRVAMAKADVRDAKVLFYTDGRRKELNMYSNNTMKAPDFNLSVAPDMATMMELARPRLMFMWMGQ
ncbi:MAG: signal peptide peptidase SppA [Deltaproteobacteria bacterium]|nr:signal peptide peptidase SppA [Deltaproteobacteria bacterium]